MLSQTLISVAPLLLAAAGLSATLWFFIQLKAEMARLTHCLPLGQEKLGRETEPSQEMKALSIRVDQLAAQIDERGPATLANAALPAVGLNIGKRILILRLSRRGDTPDHIAATLHLPRREVELLLKIHEMSLTTPAATPQTLH